MAECLEPDENVGKESISPAETDRVRGVDLDAVVRRQTPTRTRMIQVGVVLTLLLVVGGLVFGAYLAAQPRSWAGAGGDSSLNVAILSNVNHGTLTVNGTKLDVHLPMIVTLRSGTNTLTLSAPPFRPHTCTIDMAQLRIEGAQCTGDGSLSPGLTIGGKQASWWIDLPLTLADLPAEQQHRVAAAVTQALAGIVFHATVPAHQYIATGVDAQGHITSRLSDEELQADGTLVGVTPPASQPDLACVEDICTAVTVPFGPSGPADASGAADTVWRVAMFVAPHWRFTTRTGTTAATSAPSATSPLDVAAGAKIEVVLPYDAAHGWRSGGASVFVNDTTSSALDVMANAQCYAGMTALLGYHVTPPRPGAPIATNAHGIEGCEIHYLNDTAHFIWRFGVLLAADDVAHTMIPSIPVAPQAEIDAVIKQA